MGLLGATWGAGKYWTLSTQLSGANERPNLTTKFKNCQISNLYDLVWNPHAKCIQMSTNKPNNGLVVPEIASGVLRKYSQI